MTAWTHATFAPHVDEVFVAQTPDGAPVELRLTAAALRVDTERQHCFSLEFRGHRDLALEQGLYSVQHEGLGKLALFLVPVGIDEEGRLYEALFNLLKPAAG